jgi:hypothetical protein
MTRPALDPAPAHPSIFSQGIEAARANLIPGIALWVIAVGLVFCFYFVPAAQSVFLGVARLKLEYGYAFSATSTALFGGLIPLAFSLATQRGARLVLSHFAFALLFWGFKGIEFDLLYRVQAFLFGEAPTPRTVLVKVLVDQLVYCPLWGVPTMVLLYLWKDSFFQVSSTRRHLGRNWYRRLVAPMLVSNWALWAPAVTCIYLLPVPLQLPLQNIVLCFWVLMVLFMTSRQSYPPR